MVLVHGCVNAFVVAPAFAIALALDRRGQAGVVRRSETRRGSMVDS